MNEKKYLLKNIGILTISQFGSRVLSFLLVPLYTSVLTTEEYGTYDLVHTTVALLIPILTLCISDAALRFPLDEENDKKGIFSESIKLFYFSSIIVSIPLLINYFFGFSTILKNYIVYFLLMYFAQALSSICINFARGLDSIKEVGISGVICSIVMLASNVLFLVVLHIGLPGYFLANIIGPILQILYLCVSLKLWKYISIKNSYKTLKKRMLSYSIPLIANTTAWWINSSSDRYIVIWLSGVAANGLYSVAYKIPSILSVFQTIFNQAWTLSAVKDFDKKDSKGFFSDMYNLYDYSMILICSFLIICTRIVAKIMYANEFYEAWCYVPWLLISVVFGALSGFFGGIFAAVKDTKVFAQTTVISAVINIVLNIILVYFIGPIGAAIATLVSYWWVYMIRIKYVRQYVQMKLNLTRDYCAYGVLILQSALLYIIKADTIFYLIFEIAMLLSIVLLFRTETNKIWKMTVKRVIKK